MESSENNDIDKEIIEDNDDVTVCHFCDGRGYDDNGHCKYCEGKGYDSLKPKPLI